VSTRLLLATRNKGKLAELQRLLESAVPGVEVVGLADVPEYPEAPETGATFADNALLKAREAVRYTGLPAVADDSGITVDALNGMPGILSARWSGRHGDDDANTALLLGQLADVPDERRGAAFVCAAALVTPDGAEHVLEREWRGRVIREKRGGKGWSSPRRSSRRRRRTRAATGARPSRRWCPSSPRSSGHRGPRGDQSRRRRFGAAAGRRWTGVNPVRRWKYRVPVLVSSIEPPTVSVLAPWSISRPARCACRA
jgi:XTP/dITP diphosphohydrolase